MRALHRRARNIVIDWCRRLAKELVLKARRRGHSIALEDLTRLNGEMVSRDVAWRLSMFAYRKFRISVVNEAIEHNMPVVIVDPKDASTTCPKCTSQLLYDHRLAICPRCGFIGDRDRTGAANIWLKSTLGRP